MPGRESAPARPMPAHPTPAARSGRPLSGARLGRGRGRPGRDGLRGATRAMARLAIGAARAPARPAGDPARDEPLRGGPRRRGRPDRADPRGRPAGPRGPAPRRGGPRRGRGRPAGIRRRARAGIRGRRQPDQREAGDRLHDLADELQGIRDGTKPVPDDLADAPRLEGWRTTSREVRILTGRVYGHPNIPDGRRITTSDLYASDGKSWARSMSRYYRLGSPAPSRATPS